MYMKFAPKLIKAERPFRISFQPMTGCPMQYPHPLVTEDIWTVKILKVPLTDF